MNYYYLIIYFCALSVHANLQQGNTNNQALKNIAEVSYLTQAEFNNLSIQNIDDSFKNLIREDFLQSTSGGACILYSALWAIHENDELTKIFLEKIKKWKDGFVIKGAYNFQNNNNEYRAINFEKLKEVVCLNQSGLYPRSLNNSNLDQNLNRRKLLYAFGNMLQDNHFARFEFGIDNHCYYIHNDMKDVFLNKNVISLNVYKNYFLNLEPDGKIKYQDADSNGIKTLNGNFFLSIGDGAHARSVYFKKNKWYCFDNQHNKEIQLVNNWHNDIKRRGYAKSNIYIIGDFNIT